MPRLASCVAALAFLLACSDDAPSDTIASDSPAAVATTEPTTAPGVTLPHLAPDGPLEEAIVINVVDGDTIDVLIDDRESRVRYIGIDAPETVDPRRPVECFGREAAARNRDLVEGETVSLERDVSDIDRFGRLLRYVWLDTSSGQPQMVNALLVAEGYASAATFPPDVRYAELFAVLEAEAREAGLGLWGPACAIPEASPIADGPCDYSGTDEPVIKGNISQRTGEKIYHVPGGEFYDATVIDEASGERWFCTEAEAVAAGWRKSLR